MEMSPTGYDQSEDELRQERNTALDKLFAAHRTITELAGNSRPCTGTSTNWRTNSSHAWSRRSAISFPSKEVLCESFLFP
jgi:hypothetical protein